VAIRGEAGFSSCVTIAALAASQPLVDDGAQVGAHAHELPLGTSAEPADVQSRPFGTVIFHEDAEPTKVP
jgi:hypothetical protein